MCEVYFLLGEWYLQIRVLDMKRFPVCCGIEMAVDIETTTYLEVRCIKCGDTVYLKKENDTRPQMVDD